MARAGCVYSGSDKNGSDEHENTKLSGKAFPPNWMRLTRRVRPAEIRIEVGRGVPAEPGCFLLFNQSHTGDAMNSKGLYDPRNEHDACGVVSS